MSDTPEVDEPIRVLTPPGNADTQPASDAKDDAS